LISPEPPNSVLPEVAGAEEQIFNSMTALLERAGLEYRGHFLELGDKRIHYLDYGEGPIVLLLHGGGAGSAIWFRQIEELAKTHRVVVPDHPVFGLSSQTAFERPFVPSMLDYLTDFIDALGLDEFDVVGLSMGAQGALALAINSPERVKKLAVIGSAGLGKSFPLIFRLATLPLLGWLILRPNRWGQDNYFKMMEVVDSTFDDAPVYRQYAFDVTTSEGHGSAMRRSLRVTTTLVGQREIFSDSELESIKSPTLAIWGEHDKLFPVDHGVRLARLVPDARMHVVENAAHVPLLDQPDLVNGLLAGFLGRD
jgi:pimeloyl-ACP methyl ester carboxylesterase